MNGILVIDSGVLQCCHNFIKPYFLRLIPAFMVIARIKIIVSAVIMTHVRSMLKSAFDYFIVIMTQPETFDSKARRLQTIDDYQPKRETCAY